jgi:transposase
MVGVDPQRGTGLVPPVQRVWLHDAIGARLVEQARTRPAAVRASRRADRAARSRGLRSVRPEAGALELARALRPCHQAPGRLGFESVQGRLDTARGGVLRLDWKTVKALDFAAMQTELGPVDLDGIEVIGMDEFAIQKGHRYATVVVEPTRKRVLWIGRGRGRADVRPFFELLGPERCARLKAAVMDMNAGYEIEVKHHCPQAAIVFDLFHVVAKYGREVIDRARVDCANTLRDDKPARRVVKGARWLLLKNRDNLEPEQDVQLEELLATNRSLFVAYVMRDALKDLWSYRHTGYARRAWLSWYRKARRSRIEPLMRFAERLKPYLDGILAHCRYPLGTEVAPRIRSA